MGQRFFDQNGKLVGYQKTDEEAAADDAAAAAAMAGLAIVAVVLAPFFPIFWLGYQAFLYLTGELGWHELFAGATGIFVVATALFALWASKWIRVAYFTIGLIVLTAVAFGYIQSESDTIWATFWSLILFLVGSWLLVNGEQEFVDYKNSL